MQAKMSDTSVDVNETILNIIDRKEIQKVQDKLCDVANIFAFCTDGQGQWLTELTGNAEGIGQIREMISMERFNSMIKKVSESNL